MIFLFRSHYAVTCDFVDNNIWQLLYTNNIKHYKNNTRVQLPTAAENVTLLAFAAVRRAVRRPVAAVVDRYLLPTGPTAANSQLQRSIDGPDGFRTVTIKLTTKQSLRLC